MSSIDLTLLRPGARVKLRGDAKPQPNKPYPKGWQTVAETDPLLFKAGSLYTFPTYIRVESDLRWLPVSLIEEIVP